jgi:hypothetical protein
MQPSLVEAWLALARVELTQGRADGARLLLDTLAPHISRVSTWKWQELLLANDLQDETHFADSFNFILSRLPERRSEVWYLALNFWGSWPGISPHVVPEGRIAYLSELMSEKEVDVALSLWKTLEEDKNPPEKPLALQFCQFLIETKRLREAKGVWKGSKENGLSGIYVYDGDFEQEPSNTAFGWRFASKPEVVIERTAEAPFVGGHCLHLHFGGTANVNSSLVSQIIPVEPGRDYLLRFVQKSRNLTTDQGVFIEVSGYQCEGLRVQRQAITGTRMWTEEEMDVPVPDGCEAVLLQIRRNESLKLDNKISGDYWLDAVELSLRPEAKDL